jgi:hypothetical protein
MDYFEHGYEDGCLSTGSNIAASMGESYVRDVATVIANLEKDINGFAGYNTPTDKLKGDIAEFWHSGTFNTNSTVKGADVNTTVNRSHDYASADITSDFGMKYGLKYYSDGQKSANAQSASFFERFSKYKSESGRTDLSFLDYLKEKGIDDESVMYDPIYSGQVRIIPVDQWKEAVEYLKWKIAKESLTRPEQVYRYQETLNNLATKIESPDGVSSIELTESQAKEISALAKEGRFNASDFGLTTEELIDLQYIIKEGLRAGISAAIISFVLKTAPEIYKCVDKLVKQGEIDRDDLRKVGFAAMSGAATGYVRGFMAASLTTACKAGALGASLKSIDPSVMAGLTVVFMETLSDSFKVVAGDIPPNQMADNLVRNIIVTGSGIGLGIVFKVYLSIIPGSYLLGNFIGSAIGSFIYQTTDKVIMSYCLVSGSTFFGLVDQDYKLPDEVLGYLGTEVVEPDKCEPDFCEPETVEIESDEPEMCEPETIYLLRRGVIGFRRIGYL